ncbi:MAG: prepilin-type N-terminal cleavage/methylation domain-containing protein [Desulfobacteraceae bacterium]|nr:prepilin-type N-terminal cleavage/methylation domain-containing protein [Desulfobacteraceae bacterium]
MGQFILQQALKSMREAKKGFTLLELLVVLTVLLILSSFGMYLYHRSLAYAKDTVCETNLRALQESIILYSAENDALPGTLGQLKLEHLEKGYAKAMEARGWLIKASTLLIKFDASSYAYAQFLTYENLKRYGATEEIFHCPGDHNGGASYGINGALEGKSWADVGEHAIVVADSDKYVFHSIDDLSKRHNHKAFAAVKSGEVVELEVEKVAAIEEEIEPEVKDDHHPTRRPWWWRPPRHDDDEEDDADDDYGDDDDDLVKKDSDTPVAVSVPTNLKETVKHFDELVNNNIDTSIADKAEDVRNKLLSSISELSKSPPDIPAAQGNIEGAQGDLQAMIDDGLIDPEKGLALMNLLGALSSQL